jgi:hypothetical protein
MEAVADFDAVLGKFGVNSELKHSVLHYINIKYFILRQYNQL